jgi:hypothetical protein
MGAAKMVRDVITLKRDVSAMPIRLAIHPPRTAHHMPVLVESALIIRSVTKASFSGTPLRWIYGYPICSPG